MRKFVAACCCAIVGLQVLIAVPLVTCLIVLGLAESMEVPQLAGDFSASPQYAGPTPYMPPPPLTPAGFDGPTFGPPPICPAPPASPAPVGTGMVCPGPTIAPAPTDCPVPTVATILPSPVSPHVEAITEVRELVGSPLADSTLAGDPATTRADSITALEHVAAQDVGNIELTSETPTLSEPLSTLKPRPAPTDCPLDCPAKPSLMDSLQAAADQLYIKAQSLEADGNFSRADQIRTLAREIRSEIDLIRRESNPPAPVPSAVTAASFNAPLPDGPTSIHTTNPLEPATVELVEPAPFAAPAETAPEAEVEKVPQIPAP